MKIGVNILGKLGGLECVVSGLGRWLSELLHNSKAQQRVALARRKSLCCFRLGINPVRFKVRSAFGLLLVLGVRFWTKVRV